MITKDGGIETAIAKSKLPINKVDIASISNNNFNKSSANTQDQLISYGGGNSASSGFNNLNEYPS